MRSDESGTNSVARPSRATADRAVDDYAYVEVPGGRIAYEVTGQGPLVVLSHGIGDLRQSDRFWAPLLVKAGRCSSRSSTRCSAKLDGLRGLEVVA